MKLKNHREATNVQKGDVYLVTIKAVVVNFQDGKPVVRLYQCSPYDTFPVGTDGDDLPQGEKIAYWMGKEIAKPLFPILNWMEAEYD